MRYKSKKDRETSVDTKNDKKHRICPLNRFYIFLSTYIWEEYSFVNKP